MKLLLVCLFSTISLFTYASAYFDCECQVTITKIGPSRAEFKLVELVLKNNTPDSSGSRICKEYLKDSVILRNEFSDFENLKVNETYKLKRSFKSGMGPDGLVESKRWYFIKK